MARSEEYQREMAYRFYLTSTVQGYFGLKHSYADTIGYKPREIEPEVTGDEILASFLDKGLHFTKKGSETNG